MIGIIFIPSNKDKSAIIKNTKSISLAVLCHISFSGGDARVMSYLGVVFLVSEVSVVDFSARDAAGRH